MTQWPLAQAGGPLTPMHSASFHNAVRQLVSTHALAGSGQSESGTGEIFTGTPLVQNVSGSEVPQGGVLQLKQPIYSYTEDNESFVGLEPQLQATTPKDDAPIKQLAIALSPMANNDILEMGILGWYSARVNITDAAHRSAKIIDGDVTKLESSEGGIPMMPGEAGTGVKWAKVFVGGTQAVIKGGWAIIKGTVPASGNINTSNITAGTQVVTPGVLDADTTGGFTAGALLVNRDGTSLGEVVGVLNPSYTEFVGEGPGVFVAGSISEVDGIKQFSLPTKEMRSVPGFQVGVVAVDDAQGIAHMGGSRAEVVGRNECA